MSHSVSLSLPPGTVDGRRSAGVTHDCLGPNIPWPPHDPIWSTPPSPCLAGDTEGSCGIQDPVSWVESESGPVPPKGGGEDRAWGPSSRVSWWLQGFWAWPPPGLPEPTAAPPSPGSHTGPWETGAAAGQARLGCQCEVGGSGEMQRHVWVCQDWPDGLDLRRGETTAAHGAGRPCETKLVRSSGAAAHTCHGAWLREALSRSKSWLESVGGGPKGGKRSWWTGRKSRRQRWEGCEGANGLWSPE